MTSYPITETVPAAAYAYGSMLAPDGEPWWIIQGLPCPCTEEIDRTCPEHSYLIEWEPTDD